MSSGSESKSHLKNHSFLKSNRGNPLCSYSHRRGSIRNEKNCFIPSGGCSRNSWLTLHLKVGSVCISLCTKAFNSPVDGGGTAKAFSSTSFLGNTTCMLSPADTVSSLTEYKTGWVHNVITDGTDINLVSSNIICNRLSKIWQVLYRE